MTAKKPVPVVADASAAAHEINQVCQVLRLVSARPAIKTIGERGTLVAYSELAVMQRKLSGVVAFLVNQMGAEVAQDVASTYRRPLGASPLTRKDLPAGWTVEYINMPGIGKGYDLKENGASRGMYVTLQEAVQAALELSAP